MLKLLIFGIGNPGRQDDGLGSEFVEQLKQNLNTSDTIQIDFDSNYQLNIEDAETITNYDQVLFADASVESFDSYKLEKVFPSDIKVEFTMHAVSPSFIVDLSRKMFGKLPEVFVLHIKGYEWELGRKMTERAKCNLEQSIIYIKRIIETEYRLNTQETGVPTSRNEEFDPDSSGSTKQLKCGINKQRYLKN